jgi:hypothetical protein
VFGNKNVGNGILHTFFSLWRNFTVAMSLNFKYGRCVLLVDRNNSGLPETKIIIIITCFPIRQEQAKYPEK